MLLVSKNVTSRLEINASLNSTKKSVIEMPENRALANAASNTTAIVSNSKMNPTTIIKIRLT